MRNLFLAERFIDFSNDPPLSVDAQEYGECVPQNIPGLSFNMKGKAFTEMFVSIHALSIWAMDV